MKHKIFTIGLFSLTFILFFSLGTFANKTSVKVVAPEKAEKGTEITVKVEVSHKGNSKGHHTDWVVVNVNGKEHKKWEYSRDKLPKDQVFTVKFKVKAESNLEIVAEGNCNRHGSKGENKVNVVVE